MAGELFKSGDDLTQSLFVLTQGVERMGKQAPNLWPMSTALERGAKAAQRLGKTPAVEMPDPLTTQLIHQSTRL